MNRISWHSVDSFHDNRTDPILSEHRPCPVCGADRPREFLRFDDFQFFTDSATLPKRTSVCEVQCTACLALYINPAYTLAGFELLFAEAGCSYGATEEHSMEQIEWLTEHDLLKSGLSLLDVGCYDGRFLSLIPEFVRRLGVDIDGPAIQRGRLEYAGRGIELIHGDFNSFRLDTRPDTITLFHVLEHLPAPVSTLSNLRSHSHVNTQLVVEVPVLENGITNDINSFFSMQHMTHFSHRSLSNTLARAGWEITGRFEQPDYNGYRVIARPVTPQSTVHGCPEDAVVLKSLLELRNVAIDDVRTKLEVLADTDKIVVWGGGMHTEFLYHLTSLFADEQREFLIVDSDRLKQGKSWRGIKIYAPWLVNDVDWRSAKLLVSSYGGMPAIVRAALERQVPVDCIVSLYEKLAVY